MKMTDKTITEDIILNATLYIPIAKKSALACTFAEDCISKVDITLNGDDASSILPPRYQENPMMKSLYGMMTLLTNYLHMLPTDDDGNVSMDAATFDEWGEASIMNQLDRMKSSKNQEIRNRVYDILDDYREFYRMLGVEISSILANKNDMLSRFMQYFQSEITADMVKSALGGLQSALQEIKNYTPEQEQIDVSVADEGQ